MVHFDLILGLPLSLPLEPLLELMGDHRVQGIPPSLSIEFRISGRREYTLSFSCPCGEPSCVNIIDHLFSVDVHFLSTEVPNDNAASNRPTPSQMSVRRLEKNSIPENEDPGLSSQRRRRPARSIFRLNDLPGMQNQLAHLSPTFRFFKGFFNNRGGAPGSHAFGLRS
jgi:hypothetical protein